MKSNRYYDDHDDLHTHIGMLEARLIILENSMSPPSMTLPTHAAYSGSGTNGVYYVTATETVFTKLFQSHTGLMTNDALRVISQVSNSGTAVSEF